MFSLRVKLEEGFLKKHAVRLQMLELLLGSSVVMSACQCAYFRGVGEVDEKTSPEVLSAAVSEGCESCCHED